MRKTAVARRYAKALIEVGRERKAHERFGKELRDILAVFRGAPELMKVLLNPMYRIEERKSVLGKVLENLGTSTEVRRFMDILVETRNIRLIDIICSAYSKMEDELSGRLRAVVEAPFEPGAGLLEEITKRLSEATDKEVIVSVTRRPELIGGLVIKMENTILDGSVRAQLERMEEKLIEGVV